MRLIVELYRQIILGFLALAIISATFIVVRVIQSPNIATGTGAYVIGAVIITAIVVIMGMGLTATFISIHDRIEEIAESAKRMAELREHQGEGSEGDRQ